MVPSSSANFTRAIFPRCVFSWRKQRRRVMADRASSKRKFEVFNAPSNKRKKTSPNLFCSKERTWTLCDRNKIEHLLLLDCTRSYATIMCVLFYCLFWKLSDLFSHLAKSKTPNSDKSPHHHIIRERPDRRCGSSSLSLSLSLSLPLSLSLYFAMFRI